MNQMRFWTAAAIIALVVFIGFFLSVPRTRDIEENLVVVEPETAVPAVAVRDVYRKGTHTISGSVLMPNPCSTVSATASLVGTASTSQHILVDVALSPSDGVCLQVVSPGKFETTLVAPAGLSIKATVNGAVASTTTL